MLIAESLELVYWNILVETIYNLYGDERYSTIQEASLPSLFCISQNNPLIVNCLNDTNGWG